MDDRLGYTLAFATLLLVFQEHGDAMPRHSSNSSAVWQVGVAA